MDESDKKLSLVFWDWLGKFVQLVLAASVPWFVWATVSIKDLQFSQASHATKFELSAMTSKQAERAYEIESRLLRETSGIREDIREMRVLIEAHYQETTRMREEKHDE